MYKECTMLFDIIFRSVEKLSFKGKKSFFAQDSIALFPISDTYFNKLKMRNFGMEGNRFV